MRRSSGRGQESVDKNWLSRRKRTLISKKVVHRTVIHHEKPIEELPFKWFLLSRVYTALYYYYYCLY